MNKQANKELIDAIREELKIAIYEELRDTMHDDLNDATRNLLYGTEDIHIRINDLEKCFRRYQGLIGTGPTNTLKKSIREAYDAGHAAGVKFGI